MDTAPESPETPENSAPATEVAPEAPEASESVSDAPEVAEDAAGKGRAAREAARYRTQLRETEAKLSATAAKLEAVQLELARDLAVKAGLVSGDEFDLPVSEFTTEDGLVDAERVTAAVQELIKAKPYLSAHAALPRTLPVPGHGGDRDVGGGATWSQFLNGG
ncbi:MAG UNVERIFIED_CONTAM: hypothetical protein LOD86_07805 [Thermobifida fusca]